MKNRKRIIVISIVIVLLIIVCVVTGIYSFKHFETKKYNESEQKEVSQANDNIVYYNGKEYIYNYNLKNILFLGIDNESEIKVQNLPGTAGQADCIMVVSLDREEKTCKILQISRDAMTDVDIYDMQGEYYTTINAQLASQYAYGNSVSTSCWATKRTVGELLYDLPIYGYVSLDIAGFPLMNNYVEGVTITIPEDYTNIDPSFVKGKKIILDGAQAERFIRYRDVDVKGSNQERMKRQIQYIPALIDKLKSRNEDYQKTVEELTSILEPYLATDLTTEDIGELAEYNWDTQHVSYVPGEIKTGEQYEEFHIDEEKLYEMILNLYYKLKK